MRYRQLRRPTNIHVAIHTDRHSNRATLRDVSASGAKLETMSLLPPGAKIALDLLGEKRAATVVWRRGPLTGVKFDQSLNGTELMALHQPGSVSQRELGRTASHSFGHGFRELS